MSADKTSLAVFVHGLDASVENWWGTTRNALDTRQDLNYIRFKFWRYATDRKVRSALWRFFIPEPLANLDQIGRQLWSYLKAEVSEHPVNSIALFGHSMGGLVVASAIVNGLKEKGSSELDEILSRIRVIGMCATPLGGADFAKLIQYVIDYFGSNTHIANLCQDSDTRMQIVAEFINCVKLQRSADSSRILLEFFEVAQDDIVRNNHERFGPFVSQNPNKLGLQGGHVDCIKNLNYLSPNFPIIEYWLKQHLPSSSQMISEETKSPDREKKQKITRNFEMIVEELRKHMRSGGVFNEYRENKNAENHGVSYDYLLRIFLQTLIFAATRIHPFATGSANAWVCHNVDEKTGQPSSLRSEEREGYFQIDQLVTVVSSPETIAFRRFPIKFGASVQEELSAAARAVAMQEPIVVDLGKTRYDSQTERNLGITHIMGIPLFFLEKKGKEYLEGVPMAITVDFKFNIDSSQVEKVTKEILEKSKILMDLYKEFIKIWHGKISLSCIRACTQDPTSKG